jgi:hypothetical protein
VTRIRAVTLAAPAALVCWAWQGWRHPWRLANHPGLLAWPAAWLAVACLAWLLVLLPALTLVAVSGPRALRQSMIPRPVRAEGRREVAVLGERAWKAANGPLPSWLNRDLPARLERMILAADRHRCLVCRSPVRPQVDHIFAWSHGGLSSPWNLAVLCAAHNRVKSNYWRWPSGHVSYRAMSEYEADPAALAAAAEVLALEQLRRWRPGRWWRMARAAGQRP